MRNKKNEDQSSNPFGLNIVIVVVSNSQPTQVYIICALNLHDKRIMKISSAIKISGANAFDVIIPDGMQME